MEHEITLPTSKVGYAVFLLASLLIIGSALYMTALAKKDGSKLINIEIKQEKSLQEMIKLQKDDTRPKPKENDLEEWKLLDLRRCKASFHEKNMFLLVLDDDGKIWANSKDAAENFTNFMPGPSVFDLTGTNRNKFPFQSLVRKAKTGVGTSIVKWDKKSMFGSSIRSYGGFFTCIILQAI